MSEALNAARGCAGKIRYETRAEANDAKRGVIGRRGGDVPLKSYACAHCDGFHIGRDPRDRGRANDRVFLDYRGKTRRYWQLVRGEA